ncbi:MAG: biotin/lipoyl-binding protein [Thiotrichales bacterium]|jgi:RND family efflux transporter MFP subunit|nr:biotin/lipoyl-binding protein [Thiotrichales bacterium]
MLRMPNILLTLFILLVASTNSFAATIGALVDGQIVLLQVKEGDQVKKGQPLLEIDSRAIRAHIAQLKAKLHFAELELKDAKTDFDAEKALFDQTTTAKRRFDAAILVKDRASAKVDVLRNELNEAQSKLDYYVIVSPIDGVVRKLWVALGDTVFHENQKMIELEAK